MQAQARTYRKFIIPEDKHNLAAKVTNIGNLSSAIELIRRKLGQTGVQAFAKTCFGHFLDIQTVKFSSAVVHSLLIRQIECDDPKVAEFNFRGVGVRFDKKAFALVTGLKCGRPIRNTSSLPDRLWDKYFGTPREIQLKDLMEKFECRQFDEKDVDDNVRICMFYLLETVFLSGDKKKPVNNNNLKIIQDDSLVNKYPWGTLSYDMTIASVRSCVNTNNSSNTYTIYGFPIAFQVLFILVVIRLLYL